jgi:hypothetical protein
MNLTRKASNLSGLSVNHTSQMDEIKTLLNLVSYLPLFLDINLFIFVTKTNPQSYLYVTLSISDPDSEENMKTNMMYAISVCI